MNKVDEDNQKMIGKQNNQQVEKKSLLFVEVNRDLEQPWQNLKHVETTILGKGATKKNWRKKTNKC